VTNFKIQRERPNNSILPVATFLLSE